MRNKTLANCRIAGMLRAQKRHISFHTPGHKRAGADITELSYSDNLLSPCGVIGEAEKDASAILGAARSFFLTDGSTCGVFSMLYALRAAGCKRIAVPAFSHKSVLCGCEILGLTVRTVACERAAGVPLQPTAADLKAGLAEADALLLTSPDYYGNFPPLEEARALCNAENKPLVLDGAHGAHLHFTEGYAGKFADLWVDGLHKSLPALTQGAVVSAKSEFWAERLGEGVRRFRTTSPSYPVLASVEYAVKYPRNEEIERAAEALKARVNAYPNADWSKILIPFGTECDNAQRALEEAGIYPEFNDGNYLMFYLSPCTKKKELRALERAVSKLPRGALAVREGVSAYDCVFGL